MRKHAFNVQGCVKTFLLSSENHPLYVPLPTPKLHYGAIFQPAIPETRQEYSNTTLSTTNHVLSFREFLDSRRRLKSRVHAHIPFQTSLPSFAILRKWGMRCAGCESEGRDGDAIKLSDPSSPEIRLPKCAVKVDSGV